MTQEEVARQPERHVAYYRSAMARWVKPVVERDDEQHLAMVRKYGQPLVMEATRDFQQGHPHHHANAEEVPDDIATAMLFNARATLHASSNDNSRGFHVMPWLSRAPMERLYLPREFLSGHLHRWDEQCVHDLLRPLRAAIRRVPPAPRKVEERPGRNDPCACGSGKKYKKCCEGSAPPTR